MSTVLTEAERFRPVVGERAVESESARRLPPDLAAELASAGLFRMAVPQALGGPECHAATIVEAIETISRGDGSAGWCVMIGATTSVLSAYLPEPEARRIYGDPVVVTGGAFAPSGKARAVDGGHMVQGRWAWASGCQHCSWLVGGGVVLDDGRARRLDDGSPDVTLQDTDVPVSPTAGAGHGASRRRSCRGRAPLGPCTSHGRHRWRLADRGRW